MRTKQGLDFISACAAESDPARAVELFLNAIRPFGFNACAAGAWSGVGPGFVFRFFFNTWPQEWMQLYGKRLDPDKDPIVTETRRRMLPFLLSEEEEPLRAVGAGPLLDLAREFGWADVFAVPLHGPGSFCGLVSMAAFEPVRLDPAERSVLAAMSAAVHGRCRAAAGFGARSAPSPRLTPRQLECLRWAALGKSDGEIGAALGISAATAHFHVEKAKEALGARTRVEAATLLLLDGNI